MHSRHTLQALDDELHCKVLHSIGHLTTSIVEGIVNIQVERNEENDADDDLPPVLPHELVQISTSDLGNTVVDMHLPNCSILGMRRLLWRLNINTDNFVLPIVKN